MNRKIFQKFLLLCMMSFMGQMSFAQQFNCRTLSEYQPINLADVCSGVHPEKDCKIFKVYINVVVPSENSTSNNANLALDMTADIEIMKTNLQDFYNKQGIYFEFIDDVVKDDNYYDPTYWTDQPQFYKDSEIFDQIEHRFQFDKYMGTFYNMYGHADKGIEILVQSNPNFKPYDRRWIGTPYLENEDEYYEIPEVAGGDPIVGGTPLTGPLSYVTIPNFFRRVQGAAFNPTLDNFDFLPTAFLRGSLVSQGEVVHPVALYEVPIHELGHTFGLHHTFKNLEEPDNFTPDGLVTTDECLSTTHPDFPYSGYNCETAGDLVCDTPLDMNVYHKHDEFVNEYCEVELSQDAIDFMINAVGCDLSTSNYQPMTSNIMSYYPQCRSEFTPGQWERIFCVLNHLSPPLLMDCLTTSDRCEVACSSFYDNDTFTISENTSWTSANLPVIGTTGAPSGTLRIGSELRIKAGKVLILADDVTLEMGQKAKIIVERGALLEVNGATITKACDKAWSGIEVWGDGTDLSQSTAYQGKVDLNSGTTIEFARDAITTSKYYFGNRDFTSFGGIVEANGTTFKNCQRAVEFMSYHRSPHPITGVEQSNKSKFENCDFLVDNNYPNDLGVGEQITMWNTKGIRILGCEFNNTNTTLANDPEFKAIHTEDATYTVKDLGSNPSTAISNNFTGFYTGIFSSASRPFLNSIVIENSEFDNKRGIIMEGVSRSRVTENHFSADHVGVYLDHCVSYKMEDNSFDDKGSNGRSYGLVIRQSGNQANSAYNNEFDGLYVATQAQGGNRGNIALPSSGLKYTCNDYLGSNYDMSITSIDETSLFQGISATQGNGDESATNGFIDTVSGLSAENDIQNGAENVVYYYFGDDIASNTQFPGDISPGVSVNTAETENQCISSFTHGTSVGDLIGLLNTVKGEIEGGKATLHEMVDGGDTEALTEEVIYSTYSEAAELYYELMSKSPALSIEVMMQAIEKEYDLPQILLKQILEANPHAAKSREIQDKLDNRLLPLPEYMREQINAGLDIVTEKENLEATLSSNYAELARIYNELLYRYSDGADESASNFESLLASIESPHYRYQLAMYYLETGNSSLARNTFENIPNDFQLSRATTLEYQDWVAYMGLLLDVAQSQRAYTDLTANEVSSLETIADSHSYSAGQARALLRQIQEVSYEYPLYDPADQTWNNARKASIATIETPLFGLYPNPANDIVTIELKDGMELIAKNISIYDITGRMMDQINWETYNTETTIDLRKYISGIYIVKISGKNQEALASELLTIQ